MAGTRTGTASIWKHAVKIRNLYSKWGAADMEARLGADFLACIQAIVTCVAAVYTTDDLPLQIDRHAPFGPEDTGPA
jgi:hypothetical protein